MSTLQFIRRIAGILAVPVCLVHSPVYAQLVISEVFYDAVGADNGYVFVELSGPAWMPLDGIFLLGINGSNGDTYKTIPLFGVIPDDEIFVIGDDDGTGASLVPDVDLVADVDFQNGPDSVVLWDGAMSLDALGYGDFSGAVFAGEGSPALDVPAGASLARKSPFLDTGNNAADFLMAELPTPGTAASAVVPVPATLPLLLSGVLAGCTFARRKRNAGPVD